MKMSKQLFYCVYLILLVAALITPIYIIPLILDSPPKDISSESHAVGRMPKLNLTDKEKVGKTNSQLLIKPKSGLYSASSNVKELSSSEDLRIFLSTKEPTVIVFYASWCGHCRKFAPTFDAYANHSTSVILKLNSAIREGSKVSYPKLLFGAVDCPQQNSLCGKYKVNAFPTIVLFHFPDENGVLIPSKAESARFVGGSNDFSMFIQKVLFKRGELDSKSAADISNAAELKAITEESLATQATKLSHEAKSESKWHDAWMSLMYFTVHETPAEITTKQVMLLRGLLEIFYEKVGLTQESKALAVIKALQAVFYKYSNNASISGNKIKSAVVAIYGDKISWSVCGVLPSKSFLRATPSKVSHTNATTGYTCGLWMLFHGITIQADSNNRNSSNYNVTEEALHIRSLIHGFIYDFFGCAGCRAHFLYYYDNCWFNSCNIRDYTSLQLWLFKLHNLIATRIALEPVVLLGSNVSIPYLSSVLRRRLWPKIESCRGCFISQSFDLSIQSYITKNYKSVLKRTIQDATPSQDFDSIRFQGMNALETFLRHVIDNSFSEDAMHAYLLNSYRVKSLNI